MIDIKSLLNEPVSKFMSSFLSVNEDESIVNIALRMKESGVTAAIVTKGDEPIGIITERDILYKVVARGLDPKSTKASEVMSHPIQTIDEKAKVSEAIAKMAKLGIRRLAVVRDSVIIGLITQMSILSDKVNEQIRLPEVVHPMEFKCPYCGSIFKDARELSKHIDRLHIGMGLLEGDVSKW